MTPVLTRKHRAKSESSLAGITSPSTTRSTRRSCPYARQQKHGDAGLRAGARRKNGNDRAILNGLQPVPQKDRRTDRCRVEPDLELMFRRTRNAHSLGG